MEHRALIQQSLDYIEANLQASLTAAELAEQAHFSLFHYYRLFREVTGLPVMQYIQRRRLLHGVYAMGQGRGKTEAALAFGFDTYAGFYKAFCREFGVTPSEYLRSGRAKRPYRMDITKEEHMTVTHKKAAQLLENWNLHNEPVTDIYDEATGNKHDSACYVGDAYVLKFTADPAKLRSHMELSEAMEAAGLSAADPVKTADGRDYVQDGPLYFYLTKRLPDAQPVSRRLDRVDGRFVGELIGQLHLALARLDEPVPEADLLATVRDWALPGAKTALDLTNGFCQRFLDGFSALYPKLPRQIIHRDPNPSNIICGSDRWGFLDFELAERNARIYDPCYAATAVLSETFGQNNEGWLTILREILCGYDTVARLTEAEREAIPYILLANQFVCVAWFAEQEKYAELYETNRQMTLWLLHHWETLSSL